MLASGRAVADHDSLERKVMRQWYLERVADMDARFAPDSAPSRRAESAPNDSRPIFAAPCDE